MIANPTGGQVAAAVAGVVVVGGVLYLIFKPKTAQAATPGGSVQPSPSPAPPAANPNTKAAPNPCTPAPFDKLKMFANAKGYDIFYDEQTLELTTKPPANPKFIANPNAREYLTRLCSFFKWTGSQWIVDAVTDAELVAWLALSPTEQATSQFHIPGYAHGPSSMFMV